MPTRTRPARTTTTRAASFLYVLGLALLAVTSLGLPQADLLPAADAGENPSRLPRALAAYGFDAPTRAMTVEFVGPIGEDADHPRLVGTKAAATPGTLWTFQDPAPVLAILAKARTRHFAEGKFPGAMARLRIDASDAKVRRVIHLHYKPGQGDISVRAGKGPYQGGAWSYDPAADRALIALLSKTKPTAVGAPAMGIKQLRRITPQAGGSPLVWTIDSATAYQDAQATLAFRYPKTSKWQLPKAFDWKTHVLVGVELPSGLTGSRMDWSEGRVRDGVLTWRVRTVKEDKQDLHAKGGSIVLGAFPRSPRYTRVRALFDDGTTVETKVAR